MLSMFSTPYVKGQGDSDIMVLILPVKLPLVTFLSDCLSVACLSRIFQNVIDRSGQNLVDMLGVWQGRIIIKYSRVHAN